MKRLLIAVLLLSAASWAQTYFDGPAQLPGGVTTAYNSNAVINTTFPNQSSQNQYNVTAASASDLQSKITTAAANCGSTGAIVNVPAGSTYTATQFFNLPPTNCDGTHFVIIASSSLNLLPAQGTRVSSSNATNMPKLASADPINYPVIGMPDQPASPPRGYWLSGLEISDNPAGASGKQLALVIAGDYCAQFSGSGCNGILMPGGATQSSLADRFVIDRCWIHGANITSSILHGVRFTASHFAVEDSVIEDIHDTSVSPGQATGASTDFSFGPVDVGNSEIAAVTENLIFGGTDPQITNTVTSDIYIHQNYIHKPASWMAIAAFKNNMRNWIECKNCRRMLIEGNVLDVDAGNSQSAALQFTPRNSGGNCTWCVVADITARYNTFSNMSDWLSFLGANGNTGGGSLGPELPFKRGSIHDNVVEGIDVATYPGNGRIVQVNPGDASATGCSGTANTAPCQLSDISIRHNSVVSKESTSSTLALLYLATSSGNPPASSSKASNFTLQDNIVPFGLNGIAGVTGSAHPLSTYMGTVFSSFTFDTNAIADVTGTGFDCTDFPSPIRNFCGGIGQPANMAAFGFVSYNSGTGGDYHPCFGNGVPSGCTSGSPYMDQASDGFGDSAKEGPSPGANIDAVNQMTAGVIAGSYTIQPSRIYGPVKGQQQEMRLWAQFPGYFDVGASDGSGKADFSGYNSGGDPESWAGLFPFHDLQHDPASRMNLSGANVGLSDHDYFVTSSQPCGIGTSVTDSKAFWGQVSVFEQNNVRVGFLYRGPLVATGTHLPVNGTNIMWNYKWYVYRPGFIFERHSWDNNCGSSITFSTYDSSISTSVYTFDAIPGAQQYPPSFGLGWSDSAWNSNPCHGGASYDPCTGIPWGFVDFSGATAGVLFHSITSSSTQDSFFVGITDGYTNPYGNTALHYPVTAEFAKLEKEKTSAWTCCAYKASTAGGGIRSKLNGSLTIPASGNDAVVIHSFMLAGDLGVRNLTNAAVYQSEYLNPPVPTMNAGTSPSFLYDEGAWTMTADASPHVDFVTTGTMHSPIFKITSWNNSVPLINLNGVNLTPNVNYVYAFVNASTAIVQLVALPSAGNGGVSAIASGSRIIVTASPLVITTPAPALLFAGALVRGKAVEVHQVCSWLRLYECSALQLEESIAVTTK